MVQALSESLIENTKKDSKGPKAILLLALKNFLI
jgi:hypothetical protein